MTEMEDGEINLLNLVRVLYQRKIFIFLFVLLGIVLSFAVAFSLPRTYQSKSVILPTSSSGNSVLKLGTLGDLAALGGLGGLGSSSSASRLLVILKSYTLTKMVLAKLDLRPFLYAEIWDVKKNTWKESVKIPHDLKIIEDISKMVAYKLDVKDGTITLSVECKDPEMAAKIIRQYVIELQNFVEASNLITSKIDEDFFEKQLKKVKKNLFQQSKVLADFYRYNNISSLKSLVALDIGADPEDEDIVLRGSTSDGQGKVIRESVDEVPSDVYLTYLNARQKMMQGLYGSLEQQYRITRMNAEHDSLSFEVIDQAEVPYKKFKPQKGEIIIFGTTLSGFLAVVLAFLFEYISKNRDILKTITEK
jgi:uncharacterized protein involved in exopolysaccharide biosynthesis